MTALTSTIDTTALAPDAIAAVELAEARAWADCYAAAPAAFREEAGLDTTEIGGALVLRWAATGRRYFSRAIGFGATRPANEGALDAILGYWERHGIDMWLLASFPDCRPYEYEDWLRERGLEPFDAQDRIVCDVHPAWPLQHAGDRDLRVEQVTAATGDEWSDFLQRVYSLDTGDWLPRLIGRPGWHQYIAREDGEIVAARGMYVCSDGHAWLGMDAPVPGLMTQDYEPDRAICAAMVADAPLLGARRLLADIEAPSADMDTPAYRNFAGLGFTRPYVRTHWTRVA